MSSFSIVIIVLSMLLLLAGLAGCFMSHRYAVAYAYAGLIGVGLTCSDVSYGPLLFWGVASAIVIAINFMLPRAVTTSRKGTGYIVGAVVAGTFTGMIVSHAWMIVGAAVGAVLGGIAYSRTPEGGVLGFPGSRFFNYLCAKGLPAIVTASIAGTTVEWLIAALR